ncbi:hypothetical protein EYB53_001900, partial [Candidatus Chloroploca sp. M-50]
MTDTTNETFKAIPTLVIGVGGTGLKVATYIKKSLQEANRNRLPERMALMVLDTERTARFQAGGWGRERDHNHATGPVKLDIGEYIALSGTILELGKAIKEEQIEAAGDPKARRGQPRRHLSSWFQAHHYLDQVAVDSSLWNLDIGAGRYRQFGRMALFARLKQFTDSLQSALGTIKKQEASKIHVHVIGSLSGGTGSALFVDVPHIVKQIASSAGFNQAPVVFGHFVLAEGFRGTPEVELNNADRKADYDARCFAALRELKRLQGAVINQIGGYPLTYDPQGSGVLNSPMTESPYSSVYLYDGQRDNNPINGLVIEQGLAPAIADVVVAYIDDRSGDTFCAHSVNFKSFYASARIPAGTPTFGSVGTYTIELPIYHITERWVHTLARELLNTLATPSQTDGDDVPIGLIANQPGGATREPLAAAEKWLKESNTALINKLTQWAIQSGHTPIIRQQVVDEILNQDAAAWQQHLAPSDAQWQAWVDEARAKLEGSLQEKESSYFVDHQQPGNTHEQRAANLRTEVDAKLRQMIGDSEDVWMRSGGDFRSALVRLGYHHVQSFNELLVKWLREMLNGDANVGSARECKQGKLGYVQAFLRHIDGLLKASSAMLKQAAEQSSTKRKATYDAIASDRRQAADKMAHGAGFLSGNLKEYRNISDDLAQFHKADIARKVVYDLVEQLQGIVEQALQEVELWVRILATARPVEGGMYGLLLEGLKAIDLDRAQAKNEVRWVIDDQEGNDQYIAECRDRYSRDRLDELLNTIEWKIGRPDSNSPLRIELHLQGKGMDRQAGAPEQRERGARNLARLLDRCRSFYAPAWSEMSVTAYLYQNWNYRVQDLAARVYDKSGYLLQLSDPNMPPPKQTDYLRVCMHGLSQEETNFLGQLRTAVATRFGTTTSIEERKKLSEGSVAAVGHDSRDRFKLTFIMFGDLIQAHQMTSYRAAQPSYHQISGSETAWRPLHILPAENNALAIERALQTASREMQQRRRELDDKVVTLLEDDDRFRIGMRCLAYGQTDYDWQLAGARGVLLHKYTPSDRQGKSCWRLTVEPTGQRYADGRVYNNLGMLATPDHYQLTPYADEPDLLQAFVQLVCVGKDYVTKSDLEWGRIEATLEQMMLAHLQIWRGKPDPGWTPAGRTVNDASLRNEAMEQAAQIIRLRGLIEKCQQELQRYAWAWRPEGKTPERVSDEERARVQQFVDLWTAIRGVANEEMANLSRRFVQLAIWKGAIPFEQLDLDSDVGSVDQDGEVQPEQPRATPSAPTLQPEQPRVTPSAPASTWICSQGHENSSEKNFCTECREKRPDVAIAPLDAPILDPLPPLSPLPPAPGLPSEPSTPKSPKPTRVCAGPDHHPLAEGVNFCPICGKPPFVEAVLPPRVCAGSDHHPLAEGVNFCPICGKPPFVEAVLPPRVCAGSDHHPLAEGVNFCPICGKPPFVEAVLPPRV